METERKREGERLRERESERLVYKTTVVYTKLMVVSPFSAMVVASLQSNSFAGFGLATQSLLEPWISFPD